MNAHRKREKEKKYTFVFEIDLTKYIARCQETLKLKKKREM